MIRGILAIAWLSYTAGVMLGFGLALLLTCNRGKGHP
jgi:hypothetical protein